MPIFFYTDANGRKQGPINDQQLQALALQGIIRPTTPMETDTGYKGVAGQIPSLRFPEPVQTPPRKVPVTTSKFQPVILLSILGAVLTVCTLVLIIGISMRDGTDYSATHYLPKDELSETDLQKLREAAEKGNPVAQCTLGICTLYGKGMPQDSKEAVLLFQKAAESGNAEAQFRLGLLSLEKDTTVAENWIRKAADQGHVAASGLCYAVGIGVSNDQDEAFKLLQKAAEEGHDVAPFILIGGIGPSFVEDEKEIEKWLQKGAALGNIESQGALGEMLTNKDFEGRNIEEAVKWLHKLAKHSPPKERPQPYAQSMYLLGKCYYEDDGIPRDGTEAFKWFRKAAEMGNDNGINGVGLCYLNGIGVQKSATEGVRWLQKGVEKRNYKSYVNLAECYVNGTGVPRDRSQAIPLYHDVIRYSFDKDLKDIAKEGLEKMLYSLLDGNPLKPKVEAALKEWEEQENLKNKNQER